MHYYQFNIADYRKDTIHLTHLEHGIYRQLLDEYYLNEKPIKTQQVIRRLRILTQEEKTALENVLSDFFEHDAQEDSWSHKRADESLEAYKAKAEIARANGSKGGRPKKPKKTQSVNSGLAKETQTKANHKPLTNNQEPIIDMCFSEFWEAGMVKQNKKAAQKKFASILQKQSDPEQFTQRLVADVKTRLERNQIGFAELHPTTYLNNERWEDELPKQQGANYAANQSGNQQGRISSMEATLRHNAEYAAQLEREIEQEALTGHDQSLAMPQ
jgi:uncharacterized protein YdaU (DUF1376 family)